MTLTLIINGEKRLFVMGSFIPARLVRQATEAQIKLSTDNVTLADIDNVINIVVKAYDAQFTIDDFYDGVDARELYKIIGDVITYLITGKSNTH